MFSSVQNSFNLCSGKRGGLKTSRSKLVWVWEASGRVRKFGGIIEKVDQKKKKQKTPCFFWARKEPKQKKGGGDGTVKILFQTFPLGKKAKKINPVPGGWLTARKKERTRGKGHFCR